MFEWRGPAPFYFVKVDSTQSALIKERAQMLSYGWGVVHIHGEVNGQNFQSALIPKDAVTTFQSRTQFAKLKISWSEID